MTTFDDDEFDDDPFDDEGFDDDIDDIEGDEEGEGQPARRGSSNLPFLIAAGGMVLVFCIGIGAIIAYAVFLRPSGGAGVANATADAINQTNTAVFLAATQTAIGPPTGTAAPTDTPGPTEAIPTTAAPVVAGDTEPAPTRIVATREPTNTPAPDGTQTNTPTPLVELPDLSGTNIASTPTRLPTLPSGGGIAGGVVTVTPFGGGSGSGTGGTPGGSSGTPGSDTGGGVTGGFVTATALPDTGLLDDVGGPGLVVAGIVLVLALVVVRWLRSMTE